MIKIISFIINIIKNITLLIGSYSNQIFPEPLSKKEEQEYLDKMINNKDKNARNILIEHNLRLVAHIAKRFNYKNISQDDLISIGTIGLIKGIDTYKPNKDVKIATYAARCIENEILMYFRSIKKYMNTVSLDEPIGQDKNGSNITLEDILEDNDLPLDEKVYLNDNINLMKSYLNILNNREKDIIIKRYGLNNSKALTQKEIAKSMHISRSYVSRIEKRALTKILRAFLNNDKI